METKIFKQQYEGLCALMVGEIKNRLSGWFYLDTTGSCAPTYNGAKAPKLNGVIEITQEGVYYEDHGFSTWEEITDASKLLEILEWLDLHLDKLIPQKINIQWDENDLEDVAGQLEEGSNIKYDRSKFPAALDHIKKYHNAEYGVTWNTVEAALDEICKT